jgi:hypothetical protein
MSNGRWKQTVGVAFCPNGREDTRDPSQRPDVNRPSYPRWPIHCPNLGHEYISPDKRWAARASSSSPPGPACEWHQSQSTPKSRPPLLPLSLEPHHDAATCPSSGHFRRHPFDTLLVRGHSFIPASLRAAASITSRLVCRPSHRPHPPATSPRTSSDNCQADFELRTSAMLPIWAILDHT